MHPPVLVRARAASYERSSSNKEKSITDQRAENAAEADRIGVDLVAQLADGTSATGKASSRRKRWPEVLAMVPTIDLIILWEPSRGDRTLSSWAAFLELCREHGTKIHATSHARTYDMANERDWRTLAEDGVDSAYEVAKLAKRVARGLGAQAAAGRPAGKVTYGYRRVYAIDDAGKRTLVRQEEDPGGPADIVREIFKRLSKGDSATAVVRDLNARKVPTPRGAASWSDQTVRAIAHNPAYIGVRAHQPRSRNAPRRGKVAEYPAIWPALVPETQWYAVARIFGDPARQKYVGPRNGAATSLLGKLAECGDGCTDAAGRLGHARRRFLYPTSPVQHYDFPHATAPADQLDEIVSEAVIAYVSRPDVLRQLRRADDDADAAAVAARAELDRLTDELARWRQSAIDGVTSPESLAAIETGLSARVAAAQRRADAAGVSPILRGLAGAEDVRARWTAAPLAAQREIIRSLMRVKVHGMRGRGRDLLGRVEIVWLPDA